jgi:DNA-binding PadR family transcriptional regulator
MLATLLEGPKHGYELKKSAGMIFGSGPIHNNLVYPLLRRFSNEGWVVSKTVPGQRGQQRQQYELTAAGRRALIARLSEFSEEDAQSESAFRLRVSLFSLLPPETVTRILIAREGALRERDERMKAIEGSARLSAYPAEVVRFMRSQIAGELAWVRRIRNLKAKSETEVSNARSKS